MKKIISAFLLLALVLAAFASCGENKNEATQTEEPSSTEETSASVVTTTQQPIATDTATGLPVYYVPWLIKLQPEHDFLVDIPYELEYRICYYFVNSWVIDLGNTIYSSANAGSPHLLFWQKRGILCKMTNDSAAIRRPVTIHLLSSSHNLTK